MSEVIEQTEAIEPRNIDELNNVPLSEMTQDELELWIKWKEQIAASEAAASAHAEAIQQCIEMTANTYHLLAEEHREKLKSGLQLAKCQTAINALKELGNE